MRNSRIHIPVLATFAVVAFAVTITSSTAFATSLKLGNEGNYPPFSITNADGSLAGLEPDLAAAVSQAGGLGLIGASPDKSPAWLQEQIQTVRARTNRPFRVGFISSFPGLETLLQVAINERVPAISHSF